MLFELLHSYKTDATMPVRMLFELGDWEKWGAGQTWLLGAKGEKADSSAIVQQIPILLGFLHV